MKEIKDIINDRKVDAELLDAIKRGDAFVLYQPKSGQTGQNIEGSLRVGTKLFANYLGIDTDINAVGRLGTGLNQNGNSPLQFNVENGLNGVLWYDNSEPNIRNTLKFDATTTQTEGYIIHHSGNMSSGFAINNNIDITETLPSFRNILNDSFTNIDLEGKGFELVVYLEYTTSINNKIPIIRYSFDGGVTYSYLRIEPTDYKTRVARSITIPMILKSNTINLFIDAARLDNTFDLTINTVSFSFKKIGV